MITTHLLLFGMAVRGGAPSGRASGGASSVPSGAIRPRRPAPATSRPRLLLQPRRRGGRCSAVAPPARRRQAAPGEPRAAEHKEELLRRAVRVRRGRKHSRLYTHAVDAHALRARGIAEPLPRRVHLALRAPARGRSPTSSSQARSALDSVRSRTGRSLGGHRTAAGRIVTICHKPSTGGKRARTLDRRCRRSSQQVSPGPLPG